MTPLPEQKDRKIELLRKHLAKRREREEEEARQVEALARDKALQGASNGACRLNICSLLSALSAL